MARPARPHLAWLLDDAPGAWARLATVAPKLTSRCTVLSTGEPPAGILPPEVRALRLPWPRGTTRRPVVGGAPVGLGRVAAARLATFLADDAPDLVVADGLPHAALFARQCGVSTVVVHRHGRRDDAAQQVLDRAFSGFLAPYPAVLEPAGTPVEVRRRTLHAGLLSRFRGRRLEPLEARARSGLAADRPVVTVVAGRDGLGTTPDELVRAADATPDWTWLVLGRTRLDASETAGGGDLRRLGWHGDPWDALASADVVVAGAGLSTVAEVASAGRPLLVLDRPGRDEDRELTGLLAEVGVAVALGTWPDAREWPALLAAAGDRAARRLARLDDGRGAERAADWLDAWTVSPPSDLTGAAGPGCDEAHADARHAAARDGVRDVPRDGTRAQVVDVSSASVRPPAVTVAEP